MSRPTARHGRTFSPPVVALLLLLPPAIALSGCRGESPGLEEVRGAIERQLSGARLETEVTLRLGRFSLGLVKGLARLADEEEDGEDTARILSHLRRIEIGVYEVHPTGGEEVDLALPVGLERELRSRGWEVLLRAREEGEETWVFFEPAGEEIRSLYVVALDDRELALIHLQGRLDRLIAEAIADDPDAATKLFLGEGESASPDEVGVEPAEASSSG